MIAKFILRIENKLEILGEAFFIYWFTYLLMTFRTSGPNYAQIKNLISQIVDILFFFITTTDEKLRGSPHTRQGFDRRLHSRAG